jgi:gamma-D-glutamyl-L-lysine dipeptidyl-peptidase
MSGAGDVDAVVAVPMTVGWASPDAVRPIDAAILDVSPDPARWLSAMGNAERLELLGRVDTQALLGEPVIVVDERDGWSEVRLPQQPCTADDRGYPVWVRSDHLRAYDTDPAASLLTVRERLTIAYTESGEPVVVSMGTTLAVEDSRSDADGWVWVRAPLGPLRLRRAAVVARTLDLVEQAQVMLGVPYLWGGTSGWGADCSGLVHLSERARGVVVPRDSNDLSGRAARAVPDHDPVRNELLFFRYDDPARPRIHHVAIAVDSLTMLHSPKTGRVVELLPIATEPYASEVEFGASP